MVPPFLFLLHRNPIYLFLLFVGYLVAKALAVQLDIGREFQNGMVRFEYLLLRRMYIFFAVQSYCENQV
jgi:hypothetical protein